MVRVKAAEDVLLPFLGNEQLELLTNVSERLMCLGQDLYTPPSSQIPQTDE